MEDVWVVFDASTMVLCSFEKEKNAAKVQFSTVWKMIMFILYYSHASVGNTGPTFMSHDGISCSIL